MQAAEFLCGKTKIAMGPGQKEESCVSLELQTALCWLRVFIVQGTLNSEWIPQPKLSSEKGGSAQQEGLGEGAIEVK